MRPTAALLTAVALGMPLTVSAQTLDLPSRKAGLWEITMAIEKSKGLPAFTSRICLDPATDRVLMDHGLKLAAGRCRNLAPRRQGQSYVIDADCKVGGTASKTRIVITGDFDSAYTLRMESPGADKGAQGPLMTQTAAWKGADCPGMKPGDMTLPGGLKVNVKQLKALSGLLR